MKNAKRYVSLIISIMIIAGIFSVFPFTASAAGESGGIITVSSNIAPASSYSYNEYTKKVTVNYCMQSDYLVAGIQGYVSFDSSVLQLSAENTAESFFPVLNYGTTLNDSDDGYVYFNSSDISRFYNFKNGGAVITLIFDVIGSGDTEVNFNLEYLLLTKAATIAEFSKLRGFCAVYNSEVTSADSFNGSLNAAITQEEPATEPVTTQPVETEPVTTQPATSPVEKPEFSDYALKGDITSALSNSGTADTVTATVDLAAGDYKFIVQNSSTGIKYGRNASVVDTLTKAAFGANWGYCSFSATGGTYTFKYNTKYNVLTIEHIAVSLSVFSSMKLKCHVSMAMKDKGSGIISNTISLPVGVYNFGIADGDNFYGRMTTYNDCMPSSIVGNRWGFCKLNVTKPAKFEFLYDTNKKYMSVVQKSNNDSDYTVTGSGLIFTLKNTDNANIVEDTVSLGAGTYTFSITDGTNKYGRKATYTDAIEGALFGNGWDSCTFVATGGTYKFSFNQRTKYLTVTKE